MTETSKSPRMSRATKARSLVATLLFAGSGTLVLLACKTRSYNAQANQDASTPALPAALDVNDVSVLFPMPERASELGVLVPLSAKTDAGGKELVPKALFDEVIGKVEYTDAATKLKHKSGIRLEGNRADNRLRRNDIFLSGGPFAFGDYSKWHVTAMRYDPCVDLAGLKATGKATLTAFEKVEPTKCVAQLRLTVQPVFRKGDDQTGMRLRGEFDGEGNNIAITERDPEGVITGDYAMHLAFSLDHAKSKELAADLLAFRQQCKGLTAGMPLGVHPCLWRTLRGKPVHPDAFGRVRKIIETYASKLDFVAFMGTDLNLDPWVFFTGAVTPEGGFRHVPISAVRLPEGEPVPTSTKTGKPIPLPFNNGWYQMLTFVMAQGGGSDETKAGQPVVPTAVAKSVNDEVSSLIRVDNQARIDDKAAALATTMRVVNPHKNSIFTTDCVSCHRSSGLIETVLRPLGISWADKAEKDSIVAAYRAASTGPDAFPRRKGYTAIAAMDARQFNNYNVMNFAWFKGAPSVSHRAVNESVDAAHLANVSYLGATPSDDGCDVMAVEMCMYTEARDVSFDENANGTLNNRLDYTIAGLERFDMCRAKVCGKGLRAEQKPRAPRLVVTQDTSAKALAVDSAKLGEFQMCPVKKGTVIPLVPNVAPSKEAGHLVVWTPMAIPSGTPNSCFLGGASRAVYFFEKHVTVESP